MEKIRLLFLAASPKVSPLGLDEEIREITAKIREADYRDSLEVISKWAVRPDDLQQALLEYRPHVLHFSGHGTQSEELVLLDSKGDPKPVSNAALADLMRVLKDNLRLVVLNACFSRRQAEAITQVIDCAIGMDREVGDEAAIKFAGAFYRAIGFGRSIQTAFDLGRSSLLLEGIPEENTPKLIYRTGVDPASIVLIDPSDQLAQASLHQSPHSLILSPLVGLPSFAAMLAPRIFYELTRLGLVSVPSSTGQIHHYLDLLANRIEDLLSDGNRPTAYVPQHSVGIPSTTKGESDYKLPRALKKQNYPVARLLRVLSGLREGGDFTTAQLAHLGTRSRLVRNVLHTLEKYDEPAILLGDPGSGKSVTLRQIAYTFARRERRRAFPKIVVYVPLAKFNSTYAKTFDGVDSLVRDAISDLSNNVARHFDILRESQRLILLFDGMDEMRASDYNERVDLLSDYARRYSQSVKTLFACRINDFSPEFVHCQFVLLPFTKRQVSEYLDKNIALPMTLNGVSVNRGALLKRIVSDDQIDSSNPLCLFLLCSYIRERHAWPDSSTELFALYIELLRSRCHLHKDSMDKIESHWAHIAYLISSRDYGQYIDEKDISHELDVYVWTESVAQGVHAGLLMADQQGFRFCHHQLQEYLAAKHIANVFPEVDWEKALDSPPWQEIMIHLVRLDRESRAREVLSSSLRSIDMTEISKDANNEMRIAERTRLFSAVLVALQHAGGQDLEQDFQTAHSVMTDLALKGRPTTQVKMIWSCALLQGAPVVTILRPALESNVSWVREQALRFVAASPNRTLGVDIGFEVGLDLAQDNFLRRVSLYWNLLSGKHSRPALTAARSAGLAHVVQLIFLVCCIVGAYITVSIHAMAPSMHDPAYWAGCTLGICLITPILISIWSLRWRNAIAFGVALVLALASAFTLALSRGLEAIGYGLGVFLCVGYLMAWCAVASYLLRQAIYMFSSFYARKKGEENSISSTLEVAFRNSYTQLFFLIAPIGYLLVFGCFYLLQAGCGVLAELFMFLASVIGLLWSGLQLLAVEVPLPIYAVLSTAATLAMAIKRLSRYGKIREICLTAVAVLFIARLTSSRDFVAGIATVVLSIYGLFVFGLLAYMLLYAIVYGYKGVRDWSRRIWALDFQSVWVLGRRMAQQLLIFGGLTAFNLGFLALLLAPMWLKEVVGEHHFNKGVAQLLVVLALSVIIGLALIARRKVQRKRVKPANPSGPFTLDDWRSAIDRSDAIEQAVMLATFPFELPRPEMLVVFRAIETSIKEEPALSAYWQKVHGLERITRLDRESVPIRQIDDEKS